jgi:cytoskeletal protein CcmA (bactofilin family)
MPGGGQRVNKTSLPDSRLARRVARGKILATASVQSTNGLVIRGQLECSMAHHEEFLTVGRDARVTGSLQANSVTVFGHLTGNIYSEGKVFLSRGSEVNGNIHCPRIVIEEGAKFAGKINTDSATDFTLRIREPVMNKPADEDTVLPHMPPGGAARAVHSSPGTSLTT